MSNTINTTSLPWINAAKAICMICVFLFHSEFYSPIYGGFSLKTFFDPFYVNAFFIVSGYLFFRSTSKHVFCKDYVFYRLNNILFKLVIPTIFFSSLFFIPKSLFHSRDFSLLIYIHDVWGGNTSWFTSALTVTQIIMILLCICIPKRILLYSFLSLCLLLIVVLIKDYFPSSFTTVR